MNLPEIINQRIDEIGGWKAECLVDYKQLFQIGESILKQISQEAIAYDDER